MTFEFTGPLDCCFEVLSVKLLMSGSVLYLNTYPNRGDFKSPAFFYFIKIIKLIFYSYN